MLRLRCASQSLLRHCALPQMRLRMASTQAAYSPSAAFEALAITGLAKASRPRASVFVASVAGGALLAAGATLVVVAVGSSPAAAEACPGCARVAAGLLFPVGLALTVLAGADLVTASFAWYLMPARVPALVSEAAFLRPPRLAALWGTTAVGNIVGSAAAAAAVVASRVVEPGSDAAAYAAHTAEAKCALSMSTAFLKGIGANSLVNVAVVAAAGAHTPGGKVAAVWVPIATFVALGLEHSVANAFFLPLGLLCGAHIGALDIAQNMVPVFAGNFVGAALIMALYRPPGRTSAIGTAAALVAKNFVAR